MIDSAKSREELDYDFRTNHGSNRNEYKLAVTPIEPDPDKDYTRSFTFYQKNNSSLFNFCLKTLGI